MSPFYDPMIAKLVAWGEDRATARARLHRALADTALFGVTTNLGLLARIVADPDFAEGEVDTGFIERRRAALLAPPGPVPDLARAAAALHRLLTGEKAAATPAGGDRFSPWARVDGWRLNLGAAPQRLSFRCGAEEWAVSARRDKRGWQLALGERLIAAEAEDGVDGRLVVALDGVRRQVRVLEHGAMLAVFTQGESWIIEEVDPLMPPPGAEAVAGRLTSPMPGRVVQLLVAAGDQVRRGQPMMVVEAMKMEHTIAAPRDGTVASVHYAPGDLVEEGAEVIALMPVDQPVARALSAEGPG